MLSLNRSLTGIVRHVYSRDPALAKEHPDYSLEKFQATGELKYMPAKDGEKVTVFDLRPLTMDRLNEILAMPRPPGFTGLFTPQQIRESVAYGLKAIHEHGFAINGAPVALEFDQAGEERLKKSCLEAIFKFALFSELGLRVMEISDLSF